MTGAAEPVEALLDSSAIATDPRALRARLSRDGYLFMPGLLDARGVRAVRSAILEVLQRHGWLAADVDPEQRVPGPNAVREFSEGYLPMYRDLQSCRLFHELAHQRPLLELMRRILGSELLVHPRKIARVAIPHDPAFVTGPHQDFRFIQGSADVLTAWLPLHDCGPSGGALKVLRGGHRMGLLPATAAENPGGLVVPVPDGSEWLTADYREGDVLVFHSLMVHSAQPNQSGALRLSCDFRYQSIADAVDVQSLHPHGHPVSLPDWDELTTGWTSTRAVRAPDHVVVRDDASEYLDEIPTPRSALLEVER